MRVAPGDDKIDSLVLVLRLVAVVVVRVVVVSLVLFAFTQL